MIFLAHQEGQRDFERNKLKIDAETFYIKESGGRFFMCSFVRSGSDDLLILFAPTSDVHFPLADGQGVHLIVILTFQAPCYVGIGLPNIL